MHSGTNIIQNANDPIPVGVTSLPLPTGGATAAKQDTGNASLSSIDGKITTVNTNAIAGSVGIQVSGSAVTSANPVPISPPAAGYLNVNVSQPIVAGTNVIGKTGYKLVKVTANFTRPTDTNQYAVGDAITNSTSAPAVFQLDLGAAGAVNGQAIEIRKLAVVSSIKQSVLPFINAYLSNVTFTATNDNSAMDIDDTTMYAGGAWLNCEVRNYTASNSRVAYLGCAQPMVLAAADTKLYGELQATNTYTPGNAEVFTIVAWVALL